MKSICWRGGRFALARCASRLSGSVSRSSASKSRDSRSRATRRATVSKEKPGSARSIIATVIGSEGTKSNAFITRVFALKVKTGEAARGFVEQELADAEALLDATAE